MRFLKQKPTGDAASPVRLIPTEGDFPHARRRSVRVACCTTTTCCFTLLVGGIGAVGGMIYGLIRAFQSSGIESESVLLGVLLVTARFLFLVIAFTIAGTLMGAALGFGIDLIVSR